VITLSPFIEEMDGVTIVSISSLFERFLSRVSIANPSFGDDESGICFEEEEVSSFLLIESDEPAKARVASFTITNIRFQAALRGPGGWVDEASSIFGDRSGSIVD
jgi:hypothetical protein